MLDWKDRLTFKLESESSGARAGTIHTPRGTIETPIFMPVGTLGTVKTQSVDELRRAGAQIILGNTYHLYLRPGTDVLDAFGGLHRFMGWDAPILTDSGGYQFFSLSKYAKFTEDGVKFSSHHDGGKHFFSPESCIQAQASIGSDIMMQLDQCPALPATERTLDDAIRRSTNWAKRCLASAKEIAPGALFAIGQGGTDVGRRIAHIEALAADDYHGIALGGLAVGETPNEMYDTVEAVTPSMPKDRPRYLMGVGRPADILEGIARGIDMFDCVMPTRNARNGQVFTRDGKMNMRNARFKRDEAPIDAQCSCMACTHHSRAYIHHLLRNHEVLGLRLTTTHNLTYYLDLVRGARAAIVADEFDSYRSACHSAWETGEKS
ncbi:MAG: queuine tRNA-ribosyltransferase [Bradymonadia bacterium]|jgi:queuine tRNA-ribosyltransferase